jgi:hypothetical protein
VVEFCVKLGKGGEETLEMLQNAHGTEAVSLAMVFRWWRHFKDGKKWLVVDT